LLKGAAQINEVAEVVVCEVEVYGPEEEAGPDGEVTEEGRSQGLEAGLGADNDKNAGKNRLREDYLRPKIYKFFEHGFDFITCILLRLQNSDGKAKEDYLTNWL
jgi:hypothetical protein